MAYKAFNQEVTTQYRPDYRIREDAYYAKGGSFRIEFTVSGPLHENPSAHLKQATERALENTARVGKGFVQPDTPVDTGLLRSRWYYKKVRWDEWRLSNDIFYGPFNEKRVQMLEKNLPAIQAELNRQLDREIPRALN